MSLANLRESAWKRTPQPTKPDISTWKVPSFPNLASKQVSDTAPAADSSGSTPRKISQVIDLCEDSSDDGSDPLGDTTEATDYSPIQSLEPSLIETTAAPAECTGDVDQLSQRELVRGSGGRFAKKGRTLSQMHNSDDESDDDEPLAKRTRRASSGHRHESQRHHRYSRDPSIAAASEGKEAPTGLNHTSDYMHKSNATIAAKRDFRLISGDSAKDYRQIVETMILNAIDAGISSYKPRAVPAHISKLIKLPRPRSLHVEKGKILYCRIKENAETALIQVTGKQQDKTLACEKCQNGDGNFGSCVVMDGEMYGGSCANCIYGKGASKCSFRYSRPRSSGSPLSDVPTEVSAAGDEGFEDPNDTDGAEIDVVSRPLPGPEDQLVFASTSSDEDYTSQIMEIMDLFGQTFDVDDNGLQPPKVLTSKAKKLLEMEAQRPLHISKLRKFNGAKWMNREAALIQMVGQEQDRSDACYLCHKGGGIFIGCVMVDGFYNGACACCIYKADGDLEAITCLQQHSSRGASQPVVPNRNTAYGRSHAKLGSTTRLSSTADLHAFDLATHSPRKAAESARSEISRQTKAPWAASRPASGPNESATQPDERRQTRALATKDPNAKSSIPVLVQSGTLTEDEQARITMIMCIRGKPDNNLQMPFDEDCCDLKNLLKEATTGPFRGLFGAVDALEAVHAVWLRTGDELETPVLYLRPSKASSEDAYQQFLHREVKEKSAKAGRVTINVEIEPS